MTNEYLLIKFNLQIPDELYINENVLKFCLEQKDINQIEKFQSRAWNEANIQLFIELYESRKLYYVPGLLLRNNKVLSYFLEKDMDCYDFTEDSWTNDNINLFFKKEDITYIPIGLQSNNYALSKILDMHIYDLIGYFKENAWTKELITRYFNEVSTDDFEINEQLLNNSEVIKYILANGLVKQYKDFFSNYNLTNEDVESYIDSLKENKTSFIEFPNSSSLLKRVLEEKLDKYYSSFNDKAWTDECINTYLNNYSISEYSIPNILKSNSSLLHYILTNTIDFDYNVFNSTAWNEDNIKLFEKLLLNNSYNHELPYCFKSETKMLEFFILNHLTRYFNFFYNGAWTKEITSLFIGVYLANDIDVDMPFYLRYRSEVLKYVLLYNKKQYYNFFVEEAWTEENAEIIEEQIKRGLPKEMIPDILKSSKHFLNYVLDNKLSDYYDFFDSLTGINTESDKYYRILKEQPSLNLPKWFTSSARSLQIILGNPENNIYVKLFNEYAWSQDNATMYFNYFKQEKDIIIYQSMYKSSNVLNELLKQKICIDKLKYFSTDLWTESNIKDLINIISDNELIKQTLHSNFNLLVNINLKKELLKYMLDNYQELNVDKINKFSEIIVNIDNSNSSEIERLKEELAPLLVNSENSEEDFKMIEKIFLSNHLPSVAKKFYVYQIFHKNITEVKDTISPVLQHHRQYQDYIILSDLLKINIESNNDSLRNYLIRLNKGHILFMRVLQDNLTLEKLSYEDFNMLDDYTKNVYLLYNSSRYAKDTKFELTDDLISDAKKLVNLLKVEPENLLDRIIRMYFGLVGINTYDEVVKRLMESSVNATKKGIKHAEEGLIIQKGDFIKGINSVTFLDNILNNGSVATEFLGGSAKKDGDCTPLDTDCSIIEEQQSIPSIFLNQNIQATNYGNTWLVLKNDDRFTITRRDKNDLESIDNIKYQGDKLEAFSTLGKDHYGIRTGFGSTCIDYIVTKEYSQEMAFTIAKNGFYIPVYNTNGELLFTIDEYYKISNQMAGLSHYGHYIYEFSSNLDFPGIEQMISEIKNVEQETSRKKKEIEQIIKDSLSEFGLEVKTEFDSDLSRNKAFFLDIGSTGRKTNLPKESDFDYLLMLDKSIIKDKSKMQKITDKLKESLGKEKLGNGDRIVNNYDFRFVNILLNNNENIKLDITFEGKTDAINYSSDMCVIDRLNTMNKISEFDTLKARANIILGKKVLKEAGIYKSKLSSEPEGGMSAIGIENWILEHGGSFIDAANDFISVYESALEKYTNNGYISKSAVWTEFKNTYHVYNFGENYYSLRKDFIPLFGEFISNNMDEAGLYKMYNCLKSYTENIQQKKGL